MAIGIKAHKDFQIFLAGWNARLKDESYRKDIAIPLEFDAASMAFHEWRASLMAKQKKTRGFASMDPEKQREIAKLGGKAGHRLGRAHTWSSDEARAAGKKGGAASVKARENKQ